MWPPSDATRTTPFNSCRPSTVFCSSSLLVMGVTSSSSSSTAVRNDAEPLGRERSTVGNAAAAAAGLAGALVGLAATAVAVGGTAVGVAGAVGAGGAAVAAVCGVGAAVGGCVGAGALHAVRHRRSTAAERTTAAYRSSQRPRRRPVARVSVAGVSVRAMLKLAPSAASGDGTASAWLLPPSIVIDVAPAPAIVTVWPSLTVEPLLNSIEPKLVSGMMPPRPALGASSTHATDECEDAYCCVSW